NRRAMPSSGSSECPRGSGRGASSLSRNGCGHPPSSTPSHLPALILGSRLSYHAEHGCWCHQNFVHLVSEGLSAPPTTSCYHFSVPGNYPYSPKRNSNSASAPERLDWPTHAGRLDPAWVP